MFTLTFLGKPRSHARHAARSPALVRNWMDQSLKHFNYFLLKPIRDNLVPGFPRALPPWLSCTEELWSRDCGNPSTTGRKWSAINDRVWISHLLLQESRVTRGEKRESALAYYGFSTKPWGKMSDCSSSSSESSLQTYRLCFTKNTSCVLLLLLFLHDLRATMLD